MDIFAAIAIGIILAIPTALIIRGIIKNKMNAPQAMGAVILITFFIVAVFVTWNLSKGMYCGKACPIPKYVKYADQFTPLGDLSNYQSKISGGEIDAEKESEGSYGSQQDKVYAG